MTCRLPTATAAQPFVQSDAPPQGTLSNARTGLQTLLIALALFASSAARACICPPYESMTDEQAALYARREVHDADEILRGRVLNVTRVGSNTFIYLFHVQEELKSASAEQLRRLITGPDSCQLSMEVNSDWLLFIRNGRVSQCTGSSPLDIGVADLVGAPASDAAAIYDQRRAVATRWMKLVRGALGERPR